MSDTVSCRSSVVPVVVRDIDEPRHTVGLRDESGFLPLCLELEKAGFRPGDLVEIRLIERREGVLLKLPDQPWGKYGSPRPDHPDQQVFPAPKAA